MSEPLVCSADHFWVQLDGSYKFDPTRLPEAHAACFRKFVAALSTYDGPRHVTVLRGVPGSGKSTYVCNNTHTLGIVVDNVASTVAEVAPYAAAALAFGFRLSIVTLRCDPKVAGARNIHGVPQYRVESMHRAMLDSEEREFWPPWWDHKIINV